VGVGVGIGVTEGREVTDGNGVGKIFIDLNVEEELVNIKAISTMPMATNKNNWLLFALFVFIVPIFPDWGIFYNCYEESIFGRQFIIEK
jgi:hypothetical protein